MASNPYTKLGINKGVYSKLDAADKSAYKKSVYFKFLKARRDALRNAPRPLPVKPGRGERQRPIPKPSPKPTPINKGSKPQPSAVGQGYAGLGAVEMNKRKAQHTALRDIALSKHTEAYKNMITMKNLIGAHGSDPTFEKHLDSVYASADASWVKQRAQLQKAAYWNRNLRKFGK